LKQIHYNVALKQKAITYASDCGNRAAGCKFTASEAMICRWRNHYASRFSCKATTIASQGQREEHTLMWIVDAAVLHFIRETHATGCLSHGRLCK
jgi:hypothetical protein